MPFENGRDEMRSSSAYDDNEVRGAALSALQYVKILINLSYKWSRSVVHVVEIHRLRLASFEPASTSDTGRTSAHPERPRLQPAATISYCRYSSIRAVTAQGNRDKHHILVFFTGARAALLRRKLYEEYKRAISFHLRISEYICVISNTSIRFQGRLLGEAGSSHAGNTVGSWEDVVQSSLYGDGREPPKPLSLPLPPAKPEPQRPLPLQLPWSRPALVGVVPSPPTSSL